MAEAIIMPKTGMAMKEGTIISWLMKEGDMVEKGDIVAEIETDKAAMELESDAEGTILKILYEEGSTVNVTEPIAWVGSPGEAVPETESSSQIEASPQSSKEDAPREESAGAVFQEGKVAATPAARRTAREQGIDLGSVTPSGSQGEIKQQDVLDAAGSPATPLAKRMAADRGLDLSEVSGSGHRGKVFSTDLPPRPAAGEDTVVPLTTVQRLTGERMVLSSSTIPMVTEHAEADVTRLLALKDEVSEVLGERITINDIVLAAAARALKLYPRMNARLQKDSVLLLGQVNLGFAAAVDKGLVVPVIHEADRYSLAELSRRSRELISKARAGRLTQDELSGGTFTVTNVGMYGITSFTPIINPPEAGILGICAVRSLPRYIDDTLEQRKIMGLSLTFDHRIMDGAQAAAFMKLFVSMLESPASMLAR